MTHPPIAAGEGVTLHPRGPHDVDEFWPLVDRHRDDLRAWLPWIDATRSVADVRRYADYAQRAFASETSHDYAIRIDGRLCGSIGTHEIDWHNRSTSIGYWLAPGVRGRGAMTRAVAALVRQSAATLQLHRFEIRCVVDNVKSRAVAERAGFALEGLLTEAYYLHERFRDIALYGTTIDRFEASAGQRRV